MEKMNHLIKWEVVTRTQKDRCIGIGGLQNRNLALLAKSGWPFSMKTTPVGSKAWMKIEVWRSSNSAVEAELHYMNAFLVYIGLLSNQKAQWQTIGIIPPELGPYAFVGIWRGKRADFMSLLGLVTEKRIWSLEGSGVFSSVDYAMWYLELLRSYAEKVTFSLSLCTISPLCIADSDELQHCSLIAVVGFDGSFRKDCQTAVE
ncbi:hypothetical protein E5676_scaffold986G00060 [Cucumis melo var. makuwa]|uniref:Uncharacterized protein n=1 Tax=Cucumis melo var. makuwa TaxID=1194695 RepID=A0A5D3BCF6_CUCMM|nr:hypothetical protein E5676_scaffold986G00060 [Cucumis melo var. makuwa]